MERRLTIIQGDVTLLPLQQGAIFNPSNSGLILTNRGIGQQIARRAGPFIQQTLHTERSKLRQGRLEPGQVLATDAGQLQARKLVHISIVGGRKVNKRLISRGLFYAYTTADDLGLRAVGVPPIGPNISKFPMEEFMPIFWDITSEEFTSFEHIEDIFLCLDQDDDFELACAYAAEHEDEMPEGVTVKVVEGGIGLSMYSSQFSPN